MSGKKGKSGRPVGSVAYEKSVRLSVPVSMVDWVQAKIDCHKEKTRPRAKIKIKRAQLLLPLEGGDNRHLPEKKKEKK